jgi:acyl-CoA thioesterase-2
MSDVLRELVQLLRLERIEENIFRGQSQDLGWGMVFGGQVLGQALSAARQTVPEDRHCHSLHGYFLRAGDASKPIVYTVDPIRDGRSFTTRRVVGVQSGKAIFNMSASFQVVEAGFDHQAPAKGAPGPGGIPNERELFGRMAEKIPPKLKPRALGPRPIEVRPVAPHNALAPDIRPATRQVWFRAADKLGDEQLEHQMLLAWASDSHFLTTAMQPHGVSWLTPGMQVASLDHSMWFHRPFRVDEWLLYEIESPSASGARGLVLGRFYTQDGVLVASTAQEGLMRDRRA